MARGGYPLVVCVALTATICTARAAEAQDTPTHLNPFTAAFFQLPAAAPTKTDAPKATSAVEQRHVQSQSFKPGQVFFSLDPTVVFFDTPKWILGRKPGGSGNAFEYNLSEWVFRWAWTVGYVLPENLQPDFGGRNWRFHISAYYSEYQHTESTYAGPGTILPTLDGRGFATTTGSMIGTLDYHRRDWGMDWMVQTDIDWKGMTITPGAGLMYAHISQSFTLVGAERIMIPGEPQIPAMTPSSLHEQLLAHYVGPKVSCDVACSLAPGLDLFGAVSAAVTVADTRYHGTYAYENAGINGRVHDSTTETVFIGTAEVGLRKTWGNVTVGVSGGVEYWSGVPGIEHPEFGSERAEINMRDAWNAYVQAAIRISLP